MKNNCGSMKAQLKSTIYQLQLAKDWRSYYRINFFFFFFWVGGGGDRGVDRRFGTLELLFACTENVGKKKKYLINMT
jgi:hypothetical protein